MPRRRISIPCFFIEGEALLKSRYANFQMKNSSKNTTKLTVSVKVVREFGWRHEQSADSD